MSTTAHGMADDAWAMTAPAGAMAAARPVEVLVAGGLPLLCEALRTALDRRPGVSVLATVGRAASVAEEVGLRRPDVAVVCADLPGWDGIRACEDVKRLEAPARVLVLGRGDDQATLQAAISAGADGYVGTDESVEGLLGAMRRVQRGEAPIPPGMLGTLLRGLIRSRREDDAALGRFTNLSAREREVLALVAAGLDRQAISDQLYLSQHTARTHIQNILTKLGVHSQQEAATFVLDHDLLERFADTERDGLTRRVDAPVRQ
ncbi:MAG: LuxR C-terminal-related transcriptional regulator [Acidimicrobiales bacterium]